MMLTYEEARANPLVTDWDNQQIAVPWFVGKRALGDAVPGARALYGFWPANSIGDDIVIYRDDARNTVLARLSMLRQQEGAPNGEPCRSLADFVAPKESMAPDYIGVFVAEANANLDVLHAQVRQDWACTGERVVRVLAGDPSCPDTSMHQVLCDLLDASSAGISCEASVSGLFFSHPQARVFDIGRIGEDQLEDYAQRRGISAREAAKMIARSSR